MLWIGVGAQVAKAHGYLKLIPKPYNVEGCSAFNLTSLIFETAGDQFLSTTLAPATLVKRNYSTTLR